MKSDRQRPGEFHELPGARHIHVRVPIQHTEHDAVGALLVRSPNVLLHNFEFEIRVAKIASPRTNHDEQADANLLPHNGNQSGRRSNATFQQIAAEFHTLRTTAFRRNRRFH
jgi:hypothetical protein